MTVHDVHDLRLRAPASTFAHQYAPVQAVRRGDYVRALTIASGSTPTNPAVSTLFQQPLLERRRCDCPRLLLLPIEKVIVAGDDPNSFVFSRQSNQAVIVGITSCDADLGWIGYLVRQSRDRSDELARVFCADSFTQARTIEHVADLADQSRTHDDFERSLARHPLVDQSR